MKRLDPNIELIACGSSNAGMPTFADWEATVLRHCYDVADYISLHAYYEKHGDDLASYLASGTGMDRFIEGVISTADHVRAALKRSKRINLSFDEWNVWFQSDFDGEDSLHWAHAPRLIENDVADADATVVGGLLISLLNHSDRVHIACQAQLVNIIAPIRTEPGGASWRQTIFYPFALTARYARGTTLRPAIESPATATAEFGDVSMLDVAATVDDDRTAVFIVNRSPDREVETEIRLQNHPQVRRATHTALTAGNCPRSTAPRTPIRSRQSAHRRAGSATPGSP